MTDSDCMKNLKRIWISAFLCALAIWSSGVPNAFAQLQEPEVVGVEEPRTPLGEGYSSDIGFGVVLSNFGFGEGGDYNKVISDYTELYYGTGITVIRALS